MYATGTTGDPVYEYNLTTPWDISTASYVNSFSVTSQELSPQDVFFKPDGTQMFVIGASSDRVHAYNLSTVWDIGTASFVNNFSVQAQETIPQGLFFKPDGTKMYVTGSGGDSVYEYTLSTPWAITTASIVQITFLGSQDATPQNLYFRSDGAKMYFVGALNNAVYEYNLSTPWDTSTLSYVQSRTFAQSTGPSGLFFKTNGTQMYVCDAATNTLYAYNL